MSQGRPRKSLRTLLMIWFLLFSVAPLAFITAFSLRKYEGALDSELSERLKANGREVEVIIKDFESNMLDGLRQHASDKRLVYMLSTNRIGEARKLVRSWMSPSGLLSRIWVYGGDGRLEIALYRSEEGQISRESSFESSNVFLNESFLKSAAEKDEWSAVDVLASKTELRPNEAGSRMELSLFSKIRNKSGKVVGFIEEVVLIDPLFLKGLKNRMGFEILFFSPQKDSVLATHSDLAVYKSEFFVKEKNSEGILDLVIREEPHRFMVRSLIWGESEVSVGVGASKSASKSVLKNVYYAFLFVVCAIILVLVILSFVSSRIILRPIEEVLRALKTADFENEIPRIESKSDTELGLLTEYFNDMAGRIHTAQKALKEKLSELEQANDEIRNTQARLLQSAKMASLGQLVAGVAHELNNPIGFIYSNMTHLKEYSEKLVELVQLANNKPAEFKKKFKESDFDYIEKDLPRLISSCEDGARRTRDIVSGLRNFSRLDESAQKTVDLHEGIDNTLKLLSGELKNRIEVEKNYGDLPKVKCYPSQLNQVFMNLLSNAAQAIPESGTISIQTKFLKKEKKIKISIKDSGQGMDEATVNQIFDPFYTTKTMGKGTGLGLSISYGVIQRHGGEIQVESKLKKGTTFHILLPTDLPSAPPSA